MNSHEASAQKCINFPSDRTSSLWQNWLFFVLFWLYRIILISKRKYESSKNWLYFSKKCKKGKKEQVTFGVKKQWHRLVSCLFINKSEGTLVEKISLLFGSCLLLCSFFLLLGEKMNSRPISNCHLVISKVSFFPVYPFLSLGVMYLWKLR